MSVNQSVRYSNRGDLNNPNAISLMFKPGRWIPPNVGPPASSLGEIFDEYVDTSTGILYVKDEFGIWNATVNFSSVVIPADPLVINSLHSNEIQTDNTGAVQINLQTTDLLNIGPSTDLTAIQFQASGVISSNAAAGTSSLSLGDGAGNQVILDPATLAVIGSPNLNLNSSNNIVLTANAGSITAQCATTLDISAPSGVTVFGNGSGTFFNDGLGTILKVLPNSIDLNGAGDLTVSSDNNLNVTATGTLTLTSGAGNQILLAPGGGAVVEITPGANFVATNIFSSDVSGFDITTTAGPISESASTSISLTGGTSASMTASTTNLSLNATVSDIVLNAGGTVTNSGGPIRNTDGNAGAPCYSFVNDTNSGIFSGGADSFGISTGGTARVTVDNTDMILSDHILPNVDNTYDLGSGAPQFAWRNIYSNNLLNVVSDENKKRDIRDASILGLSFIEKLQPVFYNLISDPAYEKTKIGLIAQAVESAINKESLKSDEIDIVNKSESNEYTLKYEALIMALINSVKELSQNMEYLRLHIEEVEGSVDKIINVR